MAVYVTDTHPLVWYATNRRAKLSAKVFKIFNEADRGRALIYVPAIVIWEISLLVRRGRVAAGEPIGQWAARLLTQTGFEFAPLDVEVIDEASRLSSTKDPSDAVIVATARLRDLPLITRDEQIISGRQVDVIW